MERLKATGGTQLALAAEDQRPHLTDLDIIRGHDKHCRKRETEQKYKNWGNKTKWLPKRIGRGKFK